MPGHDTSSFVSRDRGLAGVINGRIFAPQNSFGNFGSFTAAHQCGRAAAQHRANRGTVARKNSTSAETYGEPQTPAEPP